MTETKYQIPTVNTVSGMINNSLSSIVRLDVANATTSSRGVVQIGDGLTIDDNGVLSVSGTVSSSSGTTTASVATASKTTQGIVKIGDNINVDSGTISVSYPTASKTTQGIVKVGNNINVDSDGTISVTFPTTTTTITSDGTIENVVTHDGNDNVCIDGFLSVVGGITSRKAIDVYDNISLSGNIVHNGDDLFDENNKINANLLPSTISSGTTTSNVNTASKTEKGIVKVGDNINVDSDGTISVTFPTTSNVITHDGSGNVSLSGKLTVSGNIVHNNTNLYGSDNKINPDLLPITATDSEGNTITLNTASKATKGLVKIGNNINVDSDGTISVDYPKYKYKFAALEKNQITQNFGPGRGTSSLQDGYKIMNEQLIQIDFYRLSDKKPVITMVEMGSNSYKKILWTFEYTDKSSSWKYAENGVYSGYYYGNAVFDLQEEASKIFTGNKINGPLYVTEDDEYVMSLNIINTEIIMADGSDNVSLSGNLTAKNNLTVQGNIIHNTTDLFNSENKINTSLLPNYTDLKSDWNNYMKWNKVEMNADIIDFCYTNGIYAFIDKNTYKIYTSTDLNSWTTPTLGTISVRSVATDLNEHKFRLDTHGNEFILYSTSTDTSLATTRFITRTSDFKTFSPFTYYHIDVSDLTNIKESTLETYGFGNFSKFTSTNPKYVGCYYLEYNANLSGTVKYLNPYGLGSKGEISYEETIYYITDEDKEFVDLCQTSYSPGNETKFIAIAKDAFYYTTDYISGWTKYSGTIADKLKDLQKCYWLENKLYIIGKYAGSESLGLLLFVFNSDMVYSKKYQLGSSSITNLSHINNRYFFRIQDTDPYVSYTLETFDGVNNHIYPSGFSKLNVDDNSGYKEVCFFNRHYIIYGNTGYILYGYPSNENIVALLNCIFPVNSFYMSIRNQINPNHIFPGTAWDVKFEDNGYTYWRRAW